MWRQPGDSVACSIVLYDCVAQWRLPHIEGGKQRRSSLRQSLVFASFNKDVVCLQTAMQDKRIATFQANIVTIYFRNISQFVW